MKWFQHDSDAMHDAKIRKLILKYGAVGYAVYFHSLELIASNISKNNITFMLEHDLTMIKDDLKIKKKNKVNEIIDYIIELGLFVKDANNRIFCFKMAERLDNTTSKNPEINKLKESIRNSYVFSTKKVSSKYMQNITNKNISKENKGKESKKESNADKSASCKMKLKMDSMPSSIKFWCKQFHHMCLQDDKFCMSVYNKIDKGKQKEFEDKKLDPKGKGYYGAVINGIKDQIQHPDSWLNLEVKTFLNKVPEWTEDLDIEINMP